MRMIRHPQNAPPLHLPFRFALARQKSHTHTKNLVSNTQHTRKLFLSFGSPHLVEHPWRSQRFSAPPARLHSLHRLFDDFPVAFAFASERAMASGTPAGGTYFPGAGACGREKGEKRRQGNGVAGQDELPRCFTVCCFV